MAATTTALRRQIGSAHELKAVVRTMKASAASSIGQYERSVAALADYARTVELGLSVCLRSAGLPRPGERAPASPGGPAVVHAIVFGSDQGLVGRFNETVVDHALAALAAMPVKARVWAVGERAQSRLEDAGMAPVGAFPVPGSVETITHLVGQILLKVRAPDEDGATDALDPALILFHNRPTAASAYAPVSLRLLPLDEPVAAQPGQAALAGDGVAGGPGHGVPGAAGLHPRTPVRVAVSRQCRIAGERKRQPAGGDAARRPQHRRTADPPQHPLPPAAPERHR